MLIVSAFKPRATWPRSIATLYGYVEPFRIVNGYGLFRVMTKSRLEIIIEGSADGVEWLPYEFKWKPGDLNQPPRWVAPLSAPVGLADVVRCTRDLSAKSLVLKPAECLLRNNRDVTRLLARNPFPDDPPRYIRATLYEYQFTSVAERKATGAWWKREERDEYLPAISLR